MKSSFACSALLLPSVALAAVVEVPFARRGPVPIAGSSSSSLLRRGGDLKRAELTTQNIARRDLHLQQSRYFPESADSELAKRATGSSALFDVDGDMQYYTTISVGTPPLALNVIVDTGSADLALATSGCAGCHVGTTFYSASTSSTSTASTTAFSVKYGTGAASGTLATDKVTISGLTVPNQTFGACSTVTSIFGENFESGLLGLGWQSLAASGATPLVQRLWEEGQLDQPVFGMAFASWIDNTSSYNTYKPGGVISLGGVQPALFQGALSYSPLTDPNTGFWSVTLQDVLVNGVSLGFKTDNAIIDSGSTLISLPASVVSQVYGEIDGAAPDDNVYNYPSNAEVNLSLVFGGVAYSVPFAFGTADNDTSRSYGVVIASSGAAQNAAVIGDAFLRHVYTAFDFAAPAVGFAPLVDTNDWLESGSQPTKVGKASVPTTPVSSVAYSPTRTSTGSKGASTAVAKTSGAGGRMAAGALAGLLMSAAVALCM